MCTACCKDKGPAILYLRQQEACEEVMGQMVDAESALKTLRRSRFQVVDLQARIQSQRVELHGA